MEFQQEAYIRQYNDRTYKLPRIISDYKMAHKIISDVDPPPQPDLIQIKLNNVYTLIAYNRPESFVCIERLITSIINETCRDMKEMNGKSKTQLIEDFSLFTGPNLKYNTVEWINMTICEFFWILFQFDTIIQIKVNSAYVILRNNIQIERQLYVLENLKNLASGFIGNLNENQAYLNLCHIADLFVHSGVREFINNGNVILETLRQHEAFLQAQVQRVEIARNRDGIFIMVGGVYVDGQNVHNTDINNSVLESLEILNKDKHQPFEAIKDGENIKMVPKDIHPILISNSLDVLKQIEIEMNNLPKQDIIHAVLERIAIDQAIFGVGRQRLRDVIQRVWHRIMNRMQGEIRQEAIKRLHQELVEAHNYCSTGHMSRILNSLSGFTGKEGGLNVIKISWNTQISNNIGAIIQKKIQQDENCEDLITYMISREKDEFQKYNDFLNKIRDNIYNDLLKDFESTFNDKTLEFTKEEFEQIFKKEYEKKLIVVKPILPSN